MWQKMQFSYFYNLRRLVFGQSSPVYPVSKSEGEHNMRVTNKNYRGTVCFTEDRKRWKFLCLILD